MEEKDYIQEDSIISEKPVNSELEQKLIDLNIKAQEIEIKLDKIEDESLKQNDQSLLDDEYYELKAEYKKIIKERKQIKKELASQDNSFLSKVSVWVVLFGIASIIVSFPLIAGNLWLSFANLLIDLLQGAFSGLSSDDFMYKVVVFLIIFSLPLLINIITWTVHINCIKTKENNKVFCGFWIIQGLMSLGMIIYMCTQLYA